MIRKNRKSKKNTKRRIKKKSSKILMNNAPIFEYYNNNKTKREKLLDKCGLPDVAETQHCFTDGTHHTCCELGAEARRYADSSGNPIGKLSEKVFKSLPNNHPKKKYFMDSNKRPWCTCFGSKVCSYYGDKFKDTKIDFISSPYENRYAEAVPTNMGCEEHVRKKFQTRSHGTPGVKNSKSECKKNNINRIAYKKI